ncbi:MAG: hypothetical protein Q8Q09_13465 [Deltaproteobacteria bacterium]|nr:hypothetical protein [Deltaproteobacteria bacterium]
MSKMTSKFTAHWSLALITACTAAIVSTDAPGQTFVRRVVRAGGVTGLEMSIDGPTHGARGATLRWQLAAHEVTGLSDLRIAAGARVRVLSSLERSRAVAELTADALGRVEASLVIPDDAPNQFQVVFETISQSNIRRQFELAVRVDSSREISLLTARTSYQVNDSVHGWGQVRSRVTGLPIANASVTLSLLDPRGRPAATRLTLTTDARGIYRGVFESKITEIGTYRLSAEHRSEHDSATAQQALSASLPTLSPIVVRAAVAQGIAAPSSRVHVEVSVRTADGRPVSQARVQSPFIPRVRGVSEQPAVLTDTRGRAHFEFVAPEIANNAALRDVSINVSAVRAGLGAGNAVAALRIARAGFFGAASVEGQALTEGLGGRVYARVVGVEGAPAGAGVEVQLQGRRMGTVRGTTDANGVAVLDVNVLPIARAPRVAARPNPNADGEEGEAGPHEDSCGGSTSTEFSMTFALGGVVGHTSGCVPIEPDATLRVRVREGALAHPGQELHVQLQRAASVARTPVQIALLAVDGGNSFPITATIAAAGANEAVLRVPAGATGLLLVRARPLFGPRGVPILGGTAALWSYNGQRAPLQISQANGRSIRVEAGSAEGLAATVAVMPSEQSEALYTMLDREDRNAGLGDLRVDFASATEALIAGAVAARTPRDQSVPSLLRNNRLVELPAPESPAAHGILRDPVRSAARFVEGRLALIFRSIETYVASHVRGQRADVAQRIGNRWEFNREIFDAIVNGSGEDTSGGARNLGGGALTIDDLRRLDTAFTFDNVAKRITRRRMFSSLVALRQFVNQHALDLRWSWRGDPTVWLTRLEAGSEDLEDENGNRQELSATDLIDGWGNRFALRPVRGRARFGFLSPVPGYELVSAGPDERMGTADDIADPFARVLPSGGAYARAVDEDGLVARLRGVELGRATIARLSSVFDLEVDIDGGDDESGSDRESTPSAPVWTAIPRRFAVDPFALAILRPAYSAPAIVHEVAALNAVSEVPIHVDDEPRTWAAVVYAYAPDGTLTFARRAFTAGTPILISLPIAPRIDELRSTLPRLRMGEPLEVLATVTSLSDFPQQLSTHVSTTGSVQASSPASLTLAPGESSEVRVQIRAATVGLGTLDLQVHDSAGQALRHASASLLADVGGLGVRNDSMASGVGSLDLVSEIPANARAVSARLVLSSAAGLADDPELDRTRRVDPALIAWSYTLAGREVPHALQDQLLAAQQSNGAVRTPTEFLHTSSPLLSTACALVVWAAASEDDRQTQAALARARNAIRRLRTPIADLDSAAGLLRAEAAALAALATGAPSTGSGDRDIVAQTIEQMRVSLRTAGESFSQQPTLLARAAAALLLADARDVRGRQFFERAKASIVDQGARGALVAAGEGRGDMSEVLAGTAAMAIAAQQLGDTALSRRLATGLALRGHLAMRAGGETVFWLLADAAFAVFGLDSVESIQLNVNGTRVAAELRNGSASVPMPNVRAGSTQHIRVSATPATATLFARWEAVYDQDVASRQDTPVALSISGDVGYTAENAALELAVTNPSSAALHRVVIELQLPAGSVLDRTALQQLRSRDNVSQVELRDGGLLRVVLNTLPSSQTFNLPLALQWMVSGTIRGLRAVAYLEDRPTRWTVLPDRVIELRARPATAQEGPSTAPAAPAAPEPPGDEEVD